MSAQENPVTDTARPQCRAFDLNLPAYLEGEDRPEVVAHARACPFCGALLADLEQIRTASRDLPLVEPPARLWANLRVALVDEGVIRDQAPFWPRWIPQLTFVREPLPVGALATLAILAVGLLTSPRRFETPQASGILPGGDRVAVASFAPAELTPAVAETVQQMEAAYRAREGSLEPALKATYKKSLETLDATIQECIRHGKREPGNALARQFLVNAYQSKAEVLASALEFNR